MKLNQAGLEKREEWQKAGYELPEYDRRRVAEETRKAPFWLHFGGGNLFRAFPANVAQELLNRRILDRGLVVAEGFDYEIIEKMNRPHDELSLLATLKADGSVEKRVVGSVVESVILDSENQAEFQRLKEIFQAPSLQMASFTITEKGYSLRDAAGELLPAVAADFREGPKKPQSYMGKVVSLLYTRYQAGERPIAMVSMDNCAHNGEKLQQAVYAFGKAWVENQRAEAGFWDYMQDPKKVSFPWTMIDKITPRPDPSIEALLLGDGIEDIRPVVTAKKTCAAPFVNAEECQYLVVEDAFPNGRPRLEEGGVLFTDRETVERVERMKVCTCLNPLHTALAVFGCLLGYEKISEEMKDPQLKKLVERIGYTEGLPMVTDPKVLDPLEFIDTVLKIRLPNPFLPDTPQRIATDTSQKLAVRFGETLRAYLAAPGLDPAALLGIPLVFAGWLRYLMGVDDQGREFGLSPDPLLETVRPYVAGFRLGEALEEETVAERLRPLLEEEKLFGVNLYRAGLAGRVCSFFVRMTAEAGGVRKVLTEFL